MEPEAVAADCETVTLETSERAPGVASVVLDRPEARNAMNERLRTEVKEVLDAIADSEIRVVVLTGSDDSGAFVSGADVTDLRERNLLEQRRLNRRRKVYQYVEELPQPVVARINGHAFGGGLELALACDVRVATQRAKLGFPEIGLGLIPGGGGTQRLPRLVGEGQAKRLILTGAPVDADEAADLGLVDLVATDEGLDETVDDLVGKMAGHSPVALQFAKEAVSASARLPQDEGIAYEGQLFVQLFATDDKDEGIDAFLEDREPDWTGR